MITLATWVNMRKLVEADKTFLGDLRGYTFFLIASYLFLQPYVLHSLSESSQHTLANHFAKELFACVVLALFSALYWFTDRKDGVSLDDFLNALIPLLMSAVVVTTSVHSLEVIWLRDQGLQPSLLFRQCSWFEDYVCVGRFLDAPSVIPYAFAVIHRVIEGHFMALFFVLYTIGLDPFRDRNKILVKVLGTNFHRGGKMLLGSSIYAISMAVAFLDWIDLGRFRVPHG
jgi:hypothetical protein